MKPSEAIGFALEQFERAKQEGVSVVSVDKSIEYLKGLQKDIAETSDGEHIAAAELKHYEAKLDDWKDSQAYVRRWYLVSFEATMGFALAALKGMLLVNGGSAVAILAFLGSAVGKQGIELDRFAPALGWFVAGVFLSMLSATLAYLSQLNFSGSRNTWGTWLQASAILAGIVSLVTFAMGSHAAYSAFLIKP